MCQKNVWAEAHYVNKKDSVSSGMTEKIGHT